LDEEHSSKSAAEEPISFDYIVNPIIAAKGFEATDLNLRAMARDQVSDVLMACICAGNRQGDAIAEHDLQVGTRTRSRAYRLDQKSIDKRVRQESGHHREALG
jgi:hypothetical protein